MGSPYAHGRLHPEGTPPAQAPNRSRITEPRGRPRLVVRPRPRPLLLAGRLVVAEADPGIVVSLRCSGEGAEFVHAVAPEVTTRDITMDYYIPPVVWSLFPLNGVLGADMSRPVLGAQVTELADGVFVAVSLNHAVADGTTFWHFINTWSEISRRSGCRDASVELSTPPPVLNRWFLDGCPVPIRLPFTRLDDIVRRPVYPPVQKCFFHFTVESVRKLKAKANAEMAGAAAAGKATISSLQALLAHTWRHAARELLPEQETTYILLVGCRGRVKGIPQGYMGNTVTQAIAKSTAGDVVGKGLGWAAWLMNRAVAAFRRGECEGGPRIVASEPQVLVRRAAQRGWRRCCEDRNRELAAVRRVWQRLRVGPAGGCPERRREQDGREGDGVRGARRCSLGSSPMKNSWRQLLKARFSLSLCGKQLTTCLLCIAEEKIEVAVPALPTSTTEGADPAIRQH